MILTETTCCGVREIDGLYSSSKKTVMAVAGDIFNYSMDGAFILFTDPPKFRRGNALSVFIKRNKLGSVVATVSKLNPNSGNKLKAYLWNWDKKALRAYWKKNGGRLDYEEDDCCCNHEEDEDYECNGCGCCF